MNDRPDHQDCDFSPESLAPQPAENVSPSGDRGVVRRWRCPRCQGVTSRRDTRVAPGKGSGESAVASIPADRVVVECDCGRPHHGRPDNVFRRGCGAYWHGV
jgi:hypothetical protein